MENNEFNKKKLIDYWINSSDDDFETMISLFDNKRYNWSLFVGHLLIEKLLKALYVKNTDEFPPFLHNLYRLSELCNLYLDEDQKLFMITVTAFNLNTRYDDYKMSFYKKCTPDYTAVWIEKIKINRIWIKQQILK